MVGLPLWLVWSSALGQGPGTYAWKLEDSVEGCQTSTSQVAGKEYIAAKSTCLFPANIEVVGAVLRDIERYPEWMEDCTQTTLLKVVDRTHEVYVFWYRQHIPVFTDRDMVLRSELTVNQEAYRVVEADVTTEVAFDSSKRFIRMPSFHAQWVLEKLEERQTRVTYLIDPELGPGLPVDIANATIARIPFESLRHMMKMVRLQKYVDAAKAPSAGGFPTRLAPANR